MPLKRITKQLFFNNRGCGKTDVSEVNPYSIKLLAEDTIGLMDALGIEKAHIVGGSMGSMIAQEIGINFPERVGKLCMMAPWCGGDQAIMPSKEMYDYLTKLECADPKTLKETDPFRIILSQNTVDHMKSEEKEKLGEMLFGNRNLGDGFQRQQIAIRDMNTVPRLKNISAPALVMACKHDILLPPENGVLIAKNIPNSQFIMLENSSHGLIEDTAIMIEKIIEFIDA